MGKLDLLKIKTAAPAFADFVAKHNALVDMIAAMTGAGGATVTVADKNIVITGGGSGAGGGAVDVVGTDGGLNKAVKHSTWVLPGPTDYPTHLQCGPSLGDKTIMESGEVTVMLAGLVAYSSIQADRIVLHGANDLEILESDLTHDMGIVTIDVCDSGTPAQMLVIGSAPF